MNTLTEETLKELEAMAALIQAQDNRCTADPLYCVMQKEKIIGMDPNYGGDYLVDRSGLRRTFRSIR